MTPARMVELRCPACRRSRWVIDHDFRFMGEPEPGYPDRLYACTRCHHEGGGYEVLQKSPPEFFLQPHPLYKMSNSDFEYWARIFVENFPDNPMRNRLYKSWSPSKSGRALNFLLHCFFGVTGFVLAFRKNPSFISAFSHLNQGPAPSLGIPHPTERLQSRGLPPPSLPE